jgi:erythromycin esterase
MQPRRLIFATSLWVLFATAVAQPADDAQEWIARHAVPIRSIDTADEDFSDLEPLISAIGSAPVVQLGEPSHGAGSSFAAKVRLIKFLHQRMGFDVLVWESGMHGMRLAQAGMRGGDDAVTAAQKGIFTIWSNTEEVRPLLQYVKASQSSARPMEMAGFDQQFTARGAFDAFATDLRAFVSKVHDPQLRKRSQELVEEALAAYERCNRNEPQCVLSLQASSAALLRTIADRRATFESAHAPREIAFMEHALENMRIMGEAKADIDPKTKGLVTAKFRDMTANFNRREAQNARNLRWLIETAYAGRKIIVWAHNVHVIDAAFEPEFGAAHLEARAGLMKPTGVYIADWLGDEAYTITFTAYAGHDGWATTNVVTPLPPVAPDSLEARLHALGKPYLFLDFRALDAQPSHAMRRPQTTRIFIPVPGHEEIPAQQGNLPIPDITRAFDAVFFVDQMAPATRIGAGSTQTSKR